jgi:hypothetical protein
VVRLIDRLKRFAEGRPTAPTVPARGPAQSFELTDEQRDCWRDQGFVLLPGLCSRDQVRVVDDEIDRMWAERADYDRDLVIDVFIDTPASAASTSGTRPTPPATCRTSSTTPTSRRPSSATWCSTRGWPR